MKLIKMSKLNELLCIGDDDIHNVRRLFNKTDNDIQEDINILLEWLQKQSHLPKFQDKGRLERLHLRNKFRIEQTKAKLENYYTVKTLYPEFYSLNFESIAIQNARKSLLFTLMPKLLPTSERIYFGEFVKDGEDYYNIQYSFQFLILYWELALSYDYSAAGVYLWDFKNMSLKHVSKLDINILHKGFLIFQQAFSERISSLHYINVPPWFDVVINIFKRVMNAKLFGKIRTYRDLRSLHEVIPKEYLPEEIGGTAGSAVELSDKWYEEMKFQKDFFEFHSKQVSDEILRIGKPIQNELFGADGTFRKINLD